MALDTAFPLSTKLQHCQLLCCLMHQLSYQKEAVSCWTILTWMSGFWLLAYFFSPFPHQSYINRLFLQGIGTSHRYGIPSVTGVESKQELKHDSII